MGPRSGIATALALCCTFHVSRSDFEYDEFQPLAALTLDYPNSTTKLLNPDNSLCNQDSRHPYAQNAVLPRPGRPIVTYLDDDLAEVTWVYPDVTRVGDYSYTIQGFILQISTGDENDLQESISFDAGKRVYRMYGMITPLEYHWRIKVQGAEIATYVSCEALLTNHNTTYIYDFTMPAESIDDAASWSYETPCIDGQLQSYSASDLWHNYTNTTFISKTMDCSSGCYLVTHDHPIFNRDVAYTFTLLRPYVDSYFSPWISIIWDQAPTGPPGIPRGISLSYRTVQLTFKKPDRMHPEFPVLEYKVEACPLNGTDLIPCLQQTTTAVPEYGDYDYTNRYFTTVILGGINYFSSYSEITFFRFVSCNMLIREEGMNVNQLTDGVADFEWNGDDWNHESRCVDGALSGSHDNDLWGMYTDAQNQTSKPMNCSMGCYEIFSDHPNYPIGSDRNYTFSFWRPYNYTLDVPHLQVHHNISYLTVVDLEPGTNFKFRVSARNHYGWSAWSFFSEPNRTLDLVPCPNNCNVPNGVCQDNGECVCLEGFGPPVNFGDPLCVNLPGNPDCENDCSTVLGSRSAEAIGAAGGRRLMGSVDAKQSVEPPAAVRLPPSKRTGAQTRRGFWHGAASPSYRVKLADREGQYGIAKEEIYEGPDYRLSTGGMSQQDVDAKYFEVDGNWIDQPAGAPHSIDEEEASASGIDSTSYSDVDLYWSSFTSVRFRLKPDSDLQSFAGETPNFSLQIEGLSNSTTSFVLIKGGLGTIAGLSLLADYRFRYQTSTRVEWSTWQTIPLPSQFDAKFSFDLIDSTTLHLQWSSPEADKYRIYLSSGTHHNIKRIIHTQGPEITLFAISTAEMMWFRVEALLDDMCVGVSSWQSHVADLDVLDLAVPLPPVIDSIGSVMAVHWQVAHTANKKRETKNRFTLQGRSELEASFTEMYVGSNSSVVLTKLQLAYRWFFRVQVGNSHGVSGWSEVTSFRANEANSIKRPVVHVKATDCVQISWNPPDEIQGDIQYAVKVLDSVLVQIQRHVSTLPTLLVKQLEPSQTFYFAVQTITSTGEVGTLSDFTKVKLPKSALHGLVPAQPIIVPHHFNTATVYWPLDKAPQEQSCGVLFIHRLDTDHKRALLIDTSEIIVVEQKQGEYRYELVLTSELGTSSGSVAATHKQEPLLDPNYLKVPSGLKAHLLDDQHEIGSFSRKVRFTWNPPAITEMTDVLAIGYLLSVKTEKPKRMQTQTALIGTEAMISIPMNPVTISFQVCALFEQAASLFSKWSHIKLDLPQKCPSGCFEHGDCLPSGICKCQLHFYGPDCSKLKQEAPLPVSARLHNSGRSFALKFDRAWFDSKLPDCASTFDAEFLPYLGSDPACVWTTEKQLSVFFGHQAQVQAEDMILVSWRRGVGGRAILQAPRQPVEPRARIVAPAEVATCDGLVLDASTSTHYGVSPLLYTWIGLGIRPKSTRSLSPHYNLHSQEMFSGQSYHYKLKVTDALGQESQKLVDVFKSEGPIPKIVFPGGLNYNIDPTKSYTVQVFTTVAICGRNAKLGFLWTVGDVLSKRLEQQSLFRRDLYFPPNTLKPGEKHLLKMKVSHQSHPSIYSISPQITINANQPPLKVSILGGDRVIQQGDSLVLNASVQSPIGRSESYVWSTRLRSAAKWHTLDCIDRTLSISAGTMVAGSHVFRLTARWDADIVTSQVLVHVADHPLIPVSILNSSVVLVNTHQDIHLVGVVGDQASHPTWTSTFGKLSGHMNVYQTSSLSSHNAVLALLPGALQPGSMYKFRLALGGQNGFAEVRIRVNQPPTGGTFRVTPLTAIHLKTKVTFSCLGGWTDDLDDLPLKFAFMHKSNQTEMMLREANPQNWFETTILPAIPPGSKNDTIEVVAEISDASGSKTVRTELVQLQNVLSAEQLEKTVAIQAELSLGNGDSGAVLSMAGIVASNRRASREQSLELLSRGLSIASHSSWILTHVVRILSSIVASLLEAEVQTVTKLLDILYSALELCAVPDPQVLKSALHILSNVATLVQRVRNREKDTIKARISELFCLCVDAISQMLLSLPVPPKILVNTQMFDLTLQRHHISTSDMDRPLIFQAPSSPQLQRVHIPSEVIAIIRAEIRKSEHSDTCFDTEITISKPNSFFWSTEDIHADILTVAVKSQSGARISMTKLSKPVLVWFQLPETQTLDTVFSPICTFWDASVLHWSSEGCHVQQKEKTAVLCACNRLADFSVTGSFMNNNTLRSGTEFDSKVRYSSGTKDAVSRRVWERTTPGPVVQIARFIKSGAELEVQFDHALVLASDQNSISTNGDCGFIFDTDTTQLFGSGARCWRPDRKHVQIQLSYDATLQPGDELSVAQNSIKRYYEESEFSVGSSVVDGNFHLHLTDGTVYGPKEFTAWCGFPRFVATVSHGSLGRPVEYSWNLYSSSNGSMWSVMKTSARRLLNYRDKPWVLDSQTPPHSFWNTSTENNDGVVDLTSTDFDSVNLNQGVNQDQYLNISVRLMNAFGMTWSKELVFAQVQSKVPAVFIEGPEDRIVIKSDTILLKAHVRLPECDADVKVANYTWSIDPLPSGSDLYSTWSRNLHVAANTLTAGISYKITLKVALNQVAESSAEIVLQIVNAPLVVGIAGGDRMYATGSNVSLIPTFPTDMDAADASNITFNWECSCDTAACPNISSSPNISSTVNALHLIEPLPGHVYNFFLTVDQGNQTANTSVWVELADDIPSVTVVQPLLPVKFDPSSSVSLAVLLNSGLMCFDPDEVSAWCQTPTWSLLAGELQHGNGDIKIFANQTNQVWLTIPGGWMMSGKTYRFRLTATDTIYTSYADVSIQMNQAPWSGSMTLRQLPLSNNENRYGFNLIGHADDPDDYPLLYSYSYRSDTGHTVPLSIESYQSHYAVADLPLGCFRTTMMHEDHCSCEAIVTSTSVSVLDVSSNVSNATNNMSEMGIESNSAETSNTITSVRCSGNVSVIGHVQDRHGAVVDVYTFAEDRVITRNTTHNVTDIFQALNVEYAPKLLRYKQLQDIEGQCHVLHEAISQANLVGRYSDETIIEQANVRCNLLQSISEMLRFDPMTHKPSDIGCSGGTQQIDGRCCRQHLNGVCNDQLWIQERPLPIFEVISLAYSQAEVLRFTNFSLQSISTIVNMTTQVKSNIQHIRDSDVSHNADIAEQNLRSMSYLFPQNHATKSTIQWFYNQTFGIGEDLLDSLSRGGDPILINTPAIQMIVHKLPQVSDFTHFVIPAKFGNRGMELSLQVSTHTKLVEVTHTTTEVTVLNISTNVTSTSNVTLTSNYTEMTANTYQLITTLHVFNVHTNSITSESVLSDVASVRLVSSSGEEAHAQHVKIVFPGNRQSLSADAVTCRYWYEPNQLWTGEGCSVVQHSPGSVECSCEQPEGTDFALHIKTECFSCSPFQQCCSGTCTRDGLCECHYGFIGEQCQGACPLNNDTGVICSGVADCTFADAALTTAHCECGEKYLGSSCHYKCPIGLEGKVCSGVGQCSIEHGCICDIAVTTSLSETVVSPIIVYENSVTLPAPVPAHVNYNCNMSCPVDKWGRQCTGNGICAGGKCLCNFGYTGTECSSMSPQLVTQAGDSCQVCPNSTFCCNGNCNDAQIARTGFGCDCDAGWRGLGCETECPFVLTYLNAYGDGYINVNSHCAGSLNGQCNIRATCDCEDQARGFDCSIVCPRSRLPHTNDTVCSNRGVCGDSGLCTCEFGYKGRACHLECPRNGDGTVCSAHGTCKEEGVGVLASAVCECDETYRGEACEKRCPVDDDGNACYNHGLCDVDANCLCIRGYMGTACQIGCERCPVSNRLCCHGQCKYTGECMCETVNGTKYVGATCELTENELRLKNHTHTMAKEQIQIKMDSSGQNFGICSNKLRLNGPYVAQTGYAFHQESQNLNAGFTTKFQFQINDRAMKCRHILNSLFDTFFYDHCYEKGADGFALVFTGSESHKSSGPSASGFVGQPGKQLGYGGMENSLAIEFDTWWNEDFEKNVGMSPHISIHTRGNLPNSADHSYSLASMPVPRLGNSLVKTVIVKYTPGNFTLDMVNEDVIDNERTSVLSPGHLYSSAYNTKFFQYQAELGVLEVFFDDLEVPIMSIPIDLKNIVNTTDGKAYVGFTSGTAEHFQTHDILQWHFCEGSDCGDKYWLQNDRENSNSFCSSTPCPRGYPWQHYPANVSRTELGSTT